MSELLGDLAREEGAQLLAIGSLHHARVQSIHDHGLELTAQVFVEAANEVVDGSRHRASKVVVESGIVGFVVSQCVCRGGALHRWARALPPSHLSPGGDRWRRIATKSKRRRTQAMRAS